MTIKPVQMSIYRLLVATSVTALVMANWMYQNPALVVASVQGLLLVVTLRAMHRSPVDTCS